MAGLSTQTTKRLFNPPRCSVRESASTNIPNNADTPIVWDVTEYDIDVESGLATPWRTGTTSKLYCHTAGLYHIGFGLSMQANATGLRIAYLRLNGSGATPNLEVQQPSASASFAPQLVGSRDLVLAEGDYIELMGYQNSGGALLTLLPTFMQTRYVAAY